MLVTPGAITYSTNVATANASNAFPPPRSVSSAYLRASGLYETTSARCAATLCLLSVVSEGERAATRAPRHGCLAAEIARLPDVVACNDPSTHDTRHPR